MSEAFSAPELERFRGLIAQCLGLWFDDGKLGNLASLLERRLEQRREPLLRYLARLGASPSSHTELREIAQELTVGETYFFRHSDQFRAFVDIALQARIEARGAVKQLRLLSAGCSSGEEAYTLAILTQQLRGARWDVAVRGIDVNPRAIARAREARYSAWALRETPDEIRDRYFTAEGRDYLLAPAVREAATFEEENLAGESPWLAESQDVVFCRNVLMYFAPEVAARVVQRFAHALAPGGYLFLGHAENLRGLSHDFELCHTHETFYYRRKSSLVRSNIPTALVASPQIPALASRPAELVDWTTTWLETVQRSADRIRALTEKPAPTVERAPAPRPTAFDLSLALELLSHERFAEALDVLGALPARSAHDADAVLLRAALLTHCGKLDAAEQTCTELLELDGLNAGAHYLRALCRERQGDARAAVEHSQTASYLEPTFAMPHLHLGLMARRSGDRERAHRELSQAALLLLREDASRLLLFGGGFSRESLIELCQSELGRLGGGG